MARYIDADALHESIDNGVGTPGLRLFAHCCVELAPTADVVPKSEVERLQAEVERLRKDNEYILMQHRFQRRPSGDCWNDVIEKAKTEVAREIFEELDFDIANLDFDSGETRAIAIEGVIAKLKKKYSEEE